MGGRLLLAFFKKSQAASGPVSIWMGDRLGYFERQILQPLVYFHAYIGEMSE